MHANLFSFPPKIFWKQARGNSFQPLLLLPTGPGKTCSARIDILEETYSKPIKGKRCSIPTNNDNIKTFRTRLAVN